MKQFVFDVKSMSSDGKFYELQWTSSLLPSVGRLDFTEVYSSHRGSWSECRLILKNLLDADKRTGQSRQFRLMGIRGGVASEDVSALWAMFKEIDDMNKAETSVNSQEKSEYKEAKMNQFVFDVKSVPSEANASEQQSHDTSTNVDLWQIWWTIQGECIWSVYIGGWDSCRFAAEQTIADAKKHNQTLEFELRKGIRRDKDDPEPKHDADAWEKMMLEMRPYQLVWYTCEQSPHASMDQLVWSGEQLPHTSIEWYRHHLFGTWDECQQKINELKHTIHPTNYDLYIRRNGTYEKDKLGRQILAMLLPGEFCARETLNEIEHGHASCHHTQVADDAANISNWQWPSPLPMPQPPVDPSPATHTDTDDNDNMASPSLGGCPQGHHLKDGPCRYDYCRCGCELCQRQCEEGGR